MTERTTTTTEAALPEIQLINSFSNSAKHQRERVLARLRQGPATTIELRSQEDIMMPAARIWELRHRYGYHIDKTWVNRPTECGQLHRVAAYVLVKEATHGQN